MYGILFTVHTGRIASMHVGHFASMEHIDGIPSKELAERVKKEWLDGLGLLKDCASAIIYEMGGQGEPPTA